MAETSALLGGLMAIINPPVYEAGMKCVERISETASQIAKNEDLEDILQSWATPFTAMSLISNRNTPLHRDNGAGYTCMDLLVSVGDYKNGWFHAPGLGFNFYYYSGTVIGINGRVVRHGGEAEGQRFCWAQYLRENVLAELKVPEPYWASLDEIVDFPV